MVQLGGSGSGFREVATQKPAGAPSSEGSTGAGGSAPKVVHSPAWQVGAEPLAGGLRSSQ